MIPAPRPEDDVDRLSALYELKVLDTPEEERFDRLSRLARQLLGVSMAFISMVDENRQWLKSGACTVGAQQTGRDISFCGHTIMRNEPLIIADAQKDDRFKDNPLVTGGPRIRFYAGFPLSTLKGYRVATLCVADTEPRELTKDELQSLKDLAALVETELNFTDVVKLQQQVRQANERLSLRNHFIRRVLGQYISDSVAESLLESPSKLELGGERRKVTLMMADLRGFTELSSRLPPEQVVAILNKYLAVVMAVIERYGGTVDNIIGDALLVLFGTPVSQGNDALRAAACAVEMQQAVSELNAAADGEAEEHQVAVGIGISTGEVVVGNIGSSHYKKYSVIGNPVNLASRIESFTLGGQILISEATLTEVQGSVRVDGRLRVKVKGISGPVFIYEVGAAYAPYDVALPEPPYLQRSEASVGSA